MRRVLAELPDCDAVFFCNDDLAHGAIFHCQRAAIAVPGRVAVAGFNDLPASSLMVPSLTTVETPRYRIGYRSGLAAAGRDRRQGAGGAPHRPRLHPARAREHLSHGSRT
jgi:DNA-binding LacI/PurR family transcriptional regulator